MLPLIFLALPITGFTLPQPWLLGFADTTLLPFLADVNGDGMADLIRVLPGKTSFADVAVTVAGQKCADPIRSIDFTGKEILAATAANLDATPGADLLALDKDGTLWLASGQPDAHFGAPSQWGKLPKPLAKPVLAAISDKEIITWAADSGQGFRLGSNQEIRLPKGTTWVGISDSDLIMKDGRGVTKRLDQGTFRPGAPLPKETALIGGKEIPLPKADLPEAPMRYLVGDLDGNGVSDVVGLRAGTELHTGTQVLVWRGVKEGDSDPDHDGLTNAEEATLGTDPLNIDSDGDGLIDGWEVNGIRDLDLKTTGCDPRHADVVCLISRFATVKADLVDRELARAKTFYADLKMKNPDGKTGLNFHAVMLDPVAAPDTNNPWWTNRDKFRPAKWRGIVHWMQITPGGGGQADELGDGGGCGEGALWAVFIHEFGHQMGLNHEGFWPNNLCPTYPSLMNYAYSYGFEDDGNKIHYSDGSLSNYILRETNLDETIPLKYEQVKFLEKGPYRFHLKPAGDNTLIDWNWNGVFGEKHVRADINYSYSTNAGLRDTMGKTTCAPWVYVHDGSAYILYGAGGKLTTQRLIKPTVWDKPIAIDNSTLTGDPVAASFRSQIHIVYQTAAGVVRRTFDGKKASDSVILDSDPNLVPTIGEYRGQLIVFLWNPADGTVTYRKWTGRDFGAPETLDVKSTNPVGICTDTITGEAIIGLAQNQDAGRPNRWQIRRYRLEKGKLEPQKWEWIEGEKGGSRGTGRVTVLFDRSKDAGPAGRIYFYCLGMTSKENPWSCIYMAHQVADKTINNGWMVKRYYDEWTQSRSAPGVAWFGKDFLYAYRWVDGGGGASDNNLQVGYRGQGIQDEPMADFDDLTYVRNFGLRNSILILGA